MTASLGVRTWRVETTLPVRTNSKEPRCPCAGCRRDLGVRIRSPARLSRWMATLGSAADCWRCGRSAATPWLWSRVVAVRP